MSYTEFDNIVIRLTDGAADASECHGHLLGLLCAHSPDAVGQWLTALTAAAPSQSDLVPEAREELTAYGRKLGATVDAGALEFQLLLPDDEEPLAERVAALAHWCQGFLFGFAQGGIRQIKGLPGDCSEIIDDISELTKVSADLGTEAESDQPAGGGSSSNEDEAALFELIEFVRVGTQLIYEELHSTDQTTDAKSH